METWESVYDYGNGCLETLESIYDSIGRVYGVIYTVFWKFEFLEYGLSSDIRSMERKNGVIGIGVWNYWNQSLECV